MPVCVECGQEKSQDEFYKVTRDSNEFRTKCKTCTSTQCAIYRKNRSDEKSKIIVMGDCSRCKAEIQEKKLSKSNRNELSGLCSACYAYMNTKDWKLKNPNKNKKLWTTSNNKNVEKRKFNRIKRTYGITKEEYYKIIESQDSLCPICRLSLNGGSQIDIDHCHETGKVRGILHNVCNRLVSCIEESQVSIEERTKNSIEYLEKYSEMEGVS